MVGALESVPTTEIKAFTAEAADVRQRALADKALPEAFQSAVLSEFSDDVSALPQDELPMPHAHQGMQPDQPFHIDPSTHPLLAFFSTMLPSSGNAR